VILSLAPRPSFWPQPSCKKFLSSGGEADVAVLVSCAYIYQATFIWIEFWGASRSFAPQANLFLEYSRYTLQKKTPSQNRGRLKVTRSAFQSNCRVARPGPKSLL
jgi:hypothetical protein